MRLAWIHAFDSMNRGEWLGPQVSNYADQICLINYSTTEDDMKTLFATAITISLLLGQSVYAQKPPQPGSPNVFPTALASVRHVMTQYEVEQHLSARGYHQFTAALSNIVVRSVSYYRNDVYGHYYLVFTNEHLAKVCAPPPFEMRKEPYMDSWVNLRVLVSPESRVEAVLCAEDMIGPGLTAALQPKTLSKRTVDCGHTAAFWLTKLFSQSSSQNERERQYEALLKTLDPYAIAIGVEMATVESRLGKPQIIEALGNGQEIRYYGSPEYGLSGSRELMWLSVVYANGKAIRVFSHDFVDQDKIRPLEEKVGKQK